MKALKVYENAILKVEDVKEPIVGDNEVKIQVKACGVCGSDIPRIFNHSAHYYPITLGHEFAGVIASVGKKVKSLTVGDHVAGIPLIPCMKCSDCINGNYSLCKNYSFIGSRRDGAMAEFVVVPENNVFKISNEIEFKSAAFIEPITVVLHAFKQNNHINSSNVAVLGMGTMGCLAVQIAKAQGAKNITAVVRNNKYDALAYKSGADNIINTSNADWLEQIDEITEGHGFDFIYETAGSADTIRRSFEIAANKAHICLIGTPKKSVIFEPELWEKINRKEFYLTGSWMSYSGQFPGTEWIIAERYLKEHKVKIYPDMINSEIPLEESYKLKDILNLQSGAGRNLLIME